MASKYLTPFDDEIREDIIKTLAYIQGIKDQEAKLKADRQEAEEWLMQTLNFNKEKEGTVHFGDEENFVSFEVSRNYKVDTKKMEDMVRDGELSEETIDRVFRWKAEVNATKWKNLDEGTKSLLSQIVTSTTGKPSIKINLATEE